MKTGNTFLHPVYFDSNRRPRPCIVTRTTGAGFYYKFTDMPAGIKPKSFFVSSRYTEFMKQRGKPFVAQQ